MYYSCFMIIDIIQWSEKNWFLIKEPSQPYTRQTSTWHNHLLLQVPQYLLPWKQFIGTLVLCRDKNWSKYRSWTLMWFKNPIRFWRHDCRSNSQYGSGICYNIIIIICDIYIAPYSARSYSKALYKIIYNIIIPGSDLFPPSWNLNSQGSIQRAEPWPITGIISLGLLFWKTRNSV